MMVEGGALEVSEEDVVEALTVAQGGIRELIGYQEELLGRAGRADKMAWEKAAVTEGLSDRVKLLADAKISEALNQKDKHTRVQAVEQV
jgi:polyribonucleotide nucleotidyltransferase